VATVFICIAMNSNPNNNDATVEDNIFISNREYLEYISLLRGARSKTHPTVATVNTVDPDHSGNNFKRFELNPTSALGSITPLSITTLPFSAHTPAPVAQSFFVPTPVAMAFLNPYKKYMLAPFLPLQPVLMKTRAAAKASALEQKAKAALQIEFLQYSRQLCSKTNKIQTSAIPTIFESHTNTSSNAPLLSLSVTVDQACTVKYNTPFAALHVCCQSFLSNFSSDISHYTPSNQQVLPQFDPNIDSSVEDHKPAAVDCYDTNTVDNLKLPAVDFKDDFWRTFWMIHWMTQVTIANLYKAAVRAAMILF
jgi:hypothetical protein